VKKELLASLLLCAAPAWAAPISPTDAKNYVGKSVTVEGIASVHTTGSGMTFIDLGGKGKGAPFTGVIFKDQASVFSNVSSYEGKTVDVTGTVKLYDGSPEIVLDKPDQLSVK
jgi:DNA/RNA endonuclease YhcR with UshA esterase domain